MARINTGDYLIRVYDKYGAELKLLREDARHYTHAVEKGEYILKRETDAASFSVFRQVYNSLDERMRF